MTVKSGAPLFTLIVSLIAICVNAVKCTIPAAIVCAFLHFVCEIDFSVKNYGIALVIILWFLNVEKTLPQEQEEIKARHEAKKEN